MVTEYIISYSVDGQPFMTTHGSIEEADKLYAIHKQSKNEDYCHMIKVTKYYETIK